MSATRVFSTFVSLLDVVATTPTDGQVWTYDLATTSWIPKAGGSFDPTKIPDGSGATATLRFLSSDPGTGWRNYVGVWLYLYNGSPAYVLGGALDFASDKLLRWSGGDPTAVATDVELRRAASGVMELRGNASTGAVLQISEVTSGGTPDSGTVRLYCKDVSGVAKLFAQNDDGTEVQLT